MYTTAHWEKCCGQDNNKLGVLDVVSGGLEIIECADGISEQEIRSATEAKIVS